MRSISSSWWRMVYFCVLGGWGMDLQERLRNYKSPGVCPRGMVTSQIEPCITYQLAKGANTVSTDICGVS